MDSATIAPIPKCLRQSTACSRDDPQPKLRPATIMSPGVTDLWKSG